ncbi:MAG: YadA-like family protein [Luteimonas sp.]
MSDVTSRKSALALFVMAACFAGSASAGDSCVLVDQDGNVISFPNPNTGQGNLDCGSGNNYDLDENEDMIVPGTFSTAVGRSNTSGGTQSTAVGYDNKALGEYASAVGDSNFATGRGSNAFGGQLYPGFGASTKRNQATGSYSNAFGAGNFSSGEQASAVGVNNVSTGFGSNAFGRNNEAVFGGNAYGSDNRALAGAANAYGYSNHAYGIGSSVFGTSNRAEGYAFGRENRIGGVHASAFGYANQVAGTFSVAIGSKVHIGTLELDNVGNPVLNASGSPTILDATTNAIGIGASGFQDDPTRIGGGAHNAIAIGRHVQIADGAVDAIAIGRDSQSLVAGSVALGAGSVAERANVVSIGNSESQRQLTNLAAGTQATDAVNLTQLRETLTQANAYTDTAVATGGTQANAYTDNREAAIRSDMADGDAATLATASTYTDTRETRIRGDMTAGDAATLDSAKSYTDSVFADFQDDFSNFRGDVDRRFDAQDQRIDKLSAMSGAYAGMAMNTAGLAGRNRIGVGVGTQSGQQALAIGYQRAVGDRASVSIGGAFGGGEKSVMGGAGFSW